MNKETIRKNPIFFAFIDPLKKHKIVDETALSPLRNINIKESDLKKSLSSPNFKTQIQHEAYSYSCFRNNTKDKVFLTEHCLSGKFLDCSLNSKINTTRLLNDKIAKTYDFDYVFHDICRYILFFEIFIFFF